MENPYPIFAGYIIEYNVGNGVSAVLPGVISFVSGKGLPDTSMLVRKPV